MRVLPRYFVKIGVIFSLIFGLSLWLFLSLPVFATLPTTLPKVVPTHPISHQFAQNSTNLPPEIGTPISDSFNNREKTYLTRWLKFRGNLGIANIFIIFFVTLGPLKIIPTFIKLTQNADETLQRNLAIRSTALSTLVILLVVVIGGSILKKWTVSMSALLLGAGILLFLSSLQLIMSQYETPNPAPPPAEPSMKLLVNPLTFPTILTPYGIALALILMIFNTQVLERPVIVPIILVLVMLLNLLAMLAARPILKAITPTTLQVLGLVLGVIQLALGLETILGGIQLQALILQDLLR